MSIDARELTLGFIKEIAPDEVVFFSEIWKDSVDGSYARQKRDANDSLMGIGDIAIDGAWLIRPCGRIPENIGQGIPESLFR